MICQQFSPSCKKPLRQVCVPSLNDDSELLKVNDISCRPGEAKFCIVNTYSPRKMCFLCSLVHFEVYNRTLA
uniref:Uncharacterized protein n=1 Tax=Physcomitrium patens TaxID=3218 RepID=A0A2K1JL01_PHYPA|nr:hypothetical protein PHYPA_017061 [Physcomitrium patens]